MDFPTDIASILQRVDSIDPKRYAKTRNYWNGAVSHLSPYISRGVISTRMVFNALQNRGYTLRNAQKFMQELTWRDYWQRQWCVLGNRINEDGQNAEYKASHFSMPKALIEGNTGIAAIDQSLREFYETGYMHNHMRMYVSSIACAVGGAHWRLPAQWMYYHLLDADWASNALSWKWVAGSNRTKKYFANQENINTYWNTHQTGTFLDVSYDEFPLPAVPLSLRECENPPLTSKLPTTSSVTIQREQDMFIYNAYNLDPFWRKTHVGNRILLLEPSLFHAYPMSAKSIDFILRLSRNISGIQLFVGSFHELRKQVDPASTVYFKEHPLNSHYHGVCDDRDWMFPEVVGEHPSFFRYWNACLKTLKSEND